MFPRRPPTDEVVSIFDALVARKGQTTAPGVAGGTSIIDSSLKGAGPNSFANMGVVLYPGQPLKVDTKTVTGFNNLTGEVTLDSAYKGVAAAIPAGIAYIMIPIQLVAGGIAPILAALTVPAKDAVANALERDAIGNKTDTPVQVAIATATLEAYAKGLVTALGDPTGDTLKSFEAKIGNLARSLTLILGTRWNVSGNLGTDIGALLASHVVATGTFTTSSTTVPADLGRTEADNYWNDCWVIPLTGAVAAQPRACRLFANAGGVFTLDKPFTAAPGAVGYILVSNQVPSSLGDATGDTLKSVVAKLGNNATDFNTRIGNPDADALKSLVAKWGNIARSLTTILGTRWNAAGDISTDIIALLGAVGGTGGTPPPPGATLLDMVSRPRVEMYEGWQEEAGIDPGLWAVTNPATGTAWQRAASTEDLMAFASPNANENARLLSKQRWIVSPTAYGINKILRRFTLEFELQVANLANFDNVNWLCGLTPTTVATRATNSIIGFALTGGGNALQTLTDLAGVETVNTGFGETLTNKNKFRIDVYLNTVDFYLNETKIASHVANLPVGPMYLNFYAPTGAGGLAIFRLGVIRAWTEDFAR